MKITTSPKIIILLLLLFGCTYNKEFQVLDSHHFRPYIDYFNEKDNELYGQYISNAAAFGFLAENIPYFDCPDKALEKTYYFRWWTYRKHIKKIEPPEEWGKFVITQFLPEVSWAGAHNVIPAPTGYDFYEGRWLKNNEFLRSHAKYWFYNKGAKPRSYTYSLADAIWANHKIHQNDDLIKELLSLLIANFEGWEKKHSTSNGLLSQSANRDGMEVAIGSDGIRPTINSSQYGDALAIARMARLVGDTLLATRFETKAEKIKTLVLEKLWDAEAQFFKVMPSPDEPLDRVREQYGYWPWFYNLPLKNAGYEVAWTQLMDPAGFYAPFGPTTAEQRNPGFSISYKGHECQWNGPSWPMATSITLTAMANVLNNYPQKHITKKDYYETLKIYANSHRKRPEAKRIEVQNGVHSTLAQTEQNNVSDTEKSVLAEEDIFWIDENLNPYSGDWIARTRLNEMNYKDGKNKERGKDYNHSSFCNLIITGLVGLRPDDSNSLVVNPLVPDSWDWFCLDNVHYQNRKLTIVWDRTGTKYKKGKGFLIFIDGELKVKSARPEKITYKME